MLSSYKDIADSLRMITQDIDTQNSIAIYRVGIITKNGRGKVYNPVLRRRIFF